jgi:hypothetical protein
LTLGILTTYNKGNGAGQEFEVLLYSLLLYHGI